MAKIPVVALVGRPNVGKSTLFNTISENGQSIVDDQPGVTRDRIYADCEWCGNNFSLVDTGGVSFEQGVFNAHIKEQVEIAVGIADVVVFVVDGLVGVTADDMKVVKLLRTFNKPLVLCVNKLDNQNLRDNTLAEFYKLGVGDPFPVSCAQKIGLGDLLDSVVQKLRAKNLLRQQPPENVKRIAIIGRPNAGKSSLVNALLGEKRVMVSDIAGTTRDAVDSPFNYCGKPYILTDTAGIRRKRSVEVETVEYYSVLRAIHSIKNSDVVLLVVDATQGLTEQDVRLAGYIHEAGKPSVIVINKWDLVVKDSYTQLDFDKKLAVDLAFMPYFQAIYISALTGQRIGEVMTMVEKVLANTEKRITTGQLNDIILDAVAMTPPPFKAAGRPKFLYATQVTVAPPTFALFVNNKNLVGRTYLRYLENTLRKSVDFAGTPVKLLLRNREKE